MFNIIVCPVQSQYGRKTEENAEWLLQPLVYWAEPIHKYYL